MRENGAATIIGRFDRDAKPQLTLSRAIAACARLPADADRRSSDRPSPAPTIPRAPDHDSPRPIDGGSYGEVWLARSVMGGCRAVKVEVAPGDALLRCQALNPLKRCILVLLTAAGVARVNFALAPDDRLAILGASGSGKITLLRLLTNLDQPTSAVIERTAGLRIGMVFQDLALWPNLTVLDNVAPWCWKTAPPLKQASCLPFSPPRVRNYCEGSPRRSRPRAPASTPETTVDDLGCVARRRQRPECSGRPFPGRGLGLSIFDFDQGNAKAQALW